MTFTVHLKDGTTKEYTGITYLNCSLGVWSLFQGQQLIAVLNHLDTIDLDVPALRGTTMAWEDEN